MPNPTRPRTRIQLAAHHRARELRQQLAQSLRQARLDAGLSERRLARAAGVGLSTVCEIERGEREGSIEVVSRLAEALGGRLSLWMQPGTGPRVRDHLQAAMIDALVAAVHLRWRARLEVQISEPVQGVIDAVLERSDPPDVVACEAHSLLLRIEQQIRWAGAKASALNVGRRATAAAATEPSRLLLLRCTDATRRTAAMYPDLLGVAYPGRCRDALDALTGTAPWPGPTLLWMDVVAGRATFRDRPPRGIAIGR
jgi:transcriptional regulator with XRE-family HTH domain